eukprot:g33510.t1
MPQGSELGPQLVTICINDLDEGTKCNMPKFADDTKLGGRVNCDEDAEILQQDLGQGGLHDLEGLGLHVYVNTISSKTSAHPDLSDIRFCVSGKFLCLNIRKTEAIVSVSTTNFSPSPPTPTLAL